MTWPAWISTVSLRGPTSTWADDVTVWSTLVAILAVSSIFARAPIGGPVQKTRLARWAAYCGYAPAARLRHAPDRPARARLHERGLGRTIKTVVAPFFAGVLLEGHLDSSAPVVDLLMRDFLRGRTGLPAAGRQALPGQLAAGLPPGHIHLHTEVENVAGRHQQMPSTVRLSDGRSIAADAVIVATDITTAPDLLPGSGVAAMTPPAPLRRSVRVGPPGSGLFVCGDHRDTPSIQGALVSGRRAADAIQAPAAAI